MIIENTIKLGSRILKNYNIDSYLLDAELILSYIMNMEREELIVNNHKEIPSKKIEKYREAIGRRIKKEPIAYILGKKEFWSQDFLVNKTTLIPRPETELLIYKIINFFKNKRINILDIGTGSGCILLSILKELNYSRGIGIDVSAKAINVAKINSKKFNLSNRAKFKVFDINEFSLGKYDLIVSNPPYIPLRDMRNLSKDVKDYEPRKALNGGNDGLEIIKRVIDKSTSLVKKNGLFAIEIGRGQYLKVSRLLRQYGYREKCKEYDYNRNVRCIISTKVNFL